jgi:hypothetical protein
MRRNHDLLAENRSLRLRLAKLAAEIALLKEFVRRRSVRHPRDATKVSH